MTRSFARKTLTAAGALALILGLPGMGRADDKLYEIKSAEAKVAAGAPGKTSVTIKGLAGWHINEEAPITLALSGDAGLTFPKAKLTRDDLADKNKEAPRFDVGFTAAEAGKKTITAEAKFVLCQETACKPVKEKIALLVDVAPAGGPAAAAPGGAAKPAAPAKK